MEGVWFECKLCKIYLPSKDEIWSHLTQKHGINGIMLDAKDRKWERRIFPHCSVLVEGDKPEKEEGDKPHPHSRGVRGRKEKNPEVITLMEVTEDDDEVEEDGGVIDTQNFKGLPGAGKELSFISSKDGEVTSPVGVGKRRREEEDDTMTDTDPEESSMKKQRGGRLRVNYPKEVAGDQGDIDKTRKRRLNYLLKQSAYYTHCLTAGDAKPGSRSKHVDNRGRKRKSEKEEDKELIEIATKEQEDGTSVGGVTFVESPSYIQNGTMRDYQVKGLNWLINLHDSQINGILADEMGLGKTIQTVALIGYLKFCRKIRGHYIVIVPKSTLANWMAEFARWAPTIKTLCLIGTEKERKSILETFRNFDSWEVLVTSYEMVKLELWALKKVNWEYLVMDEASRIKNEKTVLAKLSRQLKTKHRLLLTGTPLQNNLHELWSLLNFLLPDVFDSSENFDDWFNAESCLGDSTAVDRLHSILRPFLLRRIKADVEKGLLPKIELVVYVPLSRMQRTWYKNVLMKNIHVLHAATGETKIAQLQFILMHLRKCANHPYLFTGAEPGPPYTNDVHIIYNSGKLMVLDKLLLKLKTEGSRVLIFSQFTRTLDILDDYCVMRKFKFSRLDGQTDYTDRQVMIDEFNAPGSDKFLFMLSTRAGGLGINLASADVVILYDSDWNPQMDLQAMDRAHRIGQTKQVRVFRLVSENTVEEKIIEKAIMKLKLDHIVIQQGRLVDGSTKVTKEVMMEWVKFGANLILSDNGEECVTDETIEEILERSKVKAGQLDNETSKNLRNLTSDGGETQERSILHFEGQDYRQVRALKEKAQEAAAFLELPKRGRQVLYTKPIPRAVLDRPSKRLNPNQGVVLLGDLKDFHFAPPQLISLLEQDADIASLASRMIAMANQQGGGPGQLRVLSEAEKTEKKRLLEETFLSWSQADFILFTQLLEEHGKENVPLIASKLQKQKEEVQKYCSTFLERYSELKDGHKIMSRILMAAAKRSKKIEKEAEKRRTVSALISSQEKSNTSNNKYPQIPYVKEDDTDFSVESDSFLISAWNRFGLCDEDEVFAKIVEEIKNRTEFQHDAYLTSRSSEAIQRRCKKLLNFLWQEDIKRTRVPTPAQNSTLPID